MAPRGFQQARDAENAAGQPVQHTTPELTCFGCGPANHAGLGLESHLTEDESTLTATFTPRPVHTAGMENVLYGGLIASLIDCNSIWAAMVFRNLADGRGPDDPPAVSYVTGELNVEYRRPTPTDEPIFLRSWIEGDRDDLGKKVRVTTELGTADEVTAIGDVLAIAI